MTFEQRELQRILDLQKIQTEMIYQMVKDGWDVVDAINAVVL